MKLECIKNKSTLFKSANPKSEKLKEILLGENFIKKKSVKKYAYGYCENDKYKGWVKKIDFKKFVISKNSQINVKKAFLYSSPNIKFKTNKFIYFNSKINTGLEENNFAKYKNYWIKKNELIKAFLKKKNYLNNVKNFLNTKYVWGGNTPDGIDCSGLVQELMKNCGQSCPRDSKDQIKFFKKKINLKNIKKGDLLFWKGHVAIALNKKKLIHAFGPIKKVIIMPIAKTVTDLKKKSLPLLSIKRPFK